MSDEDRLLGNGILDSLAILDVVAFIEKEFHITISDDELLPENFNSISNMAVFVQSKIEVTASAQ
jgi:acyl carrier protein